MKRHVWWGRMDRGINGERKSWSPLGHVLRLRQSTLICSVVPGEKRHDQLVLHLTAQLLGHCLKEL